MLELHGRLAYEYSAGRLTALYCNLNQIRVRSFILSGAPFHAHAAETSQLRLPRNRAISPLQEANRGPNFRFCRRKPGRCAAIRVLAPERKSVTSEPFSAG